MALSPQFKIKSSSQMDIGIHLLTTVIIKFVILRRSVPHNLILNDLREVKPFQRTKGTRSPTSKPICIQETRSFSQSERLEGRKGLSKNERSLVLRYESHLRKRNETDQHNNVGLVIFS